MASVPPGFNLVSHSDAPEQVILLKRALWVVGTWNIYRKRGKYSRVFDNFVTRSGEIRPIEAGGGGTAEVPQEEEEVRGAEQRLERREHGRGLVGRGADLAPRGLRGGAQRQPEERRRGAVA